MIDEILKELEEYGMPMTWEEYKEATEISSSGFTAHWNPIAKADKYEVDLYGVNQVFEDEPNFIIFDEDFDNVSNFTDALSIYSPDVVGSEQ